MYQIPKRLERTHDLVKSSYKKFTRIMLTGLLTLILSLVFLIIYAINSLPNQPIWSQSLITQVSGVIIIALLVVTGGLFQFAGTFPFEKRIFLKVYKAQILVERFASLSGVPTQDKSDLKKAKKILIRVSNDLLARKRKNPTLELSKEANQMYFELGKLIQTKILFLLEDEKRMGLAQQHILDILRLFAFPKFSNIEKHISVIKTIDGGIPFQPRRGVLEQNQRLVSFVGHLCKFGISFISVFIVANIYSYFFLTPLSSIAPHMLTSTFALFAAWEFKSK